MPKSYHHLTQNLKSQIYILKSIGISMRKIAQKLGVHVSTISREIKRNEGERGYRYQQAATEAAERRSNASQTPTKLTVNCKIVKRKLLRSY